MQKYDKDGCDELIEALSFFFDFLIENRKIEELVYFSISLSRLMDEVAQRSKALYKRPVKEVVKVH